MGIILTFTRAESPAPKTAHMGVAGPTPRLTIGNAPSIIGRRAAAKELLHRLNHPYAIANILLDEDGDPYIIPPSGALHPHPDDAGKDVCTSYIYGCPAPKRSSRAIELPNEKILESSL
jgi:hypothetical protein